MIDEAMRLPSGDGDMATEARGRLAARVLADPTLAEVFARLERDIVEAWRASATPETEAREWLYLRLSALGALKQELHLLVEEGRLAERERIGRAHEAAARRSGGTAAGDPP